MLRGHKVGMDEQLAIIICVAQDILGRMPGHGQDRGPHFVVRLDCSLGLCVPNSKLAVKTCCRKESAVGRPSCCSDITGMARFERALTFPITTRYNLEV